MGVFVCEHCIGSRVLPIGGHMRTKSVEKMELIRETAGEYYRRFHRAPTTGELAGEVGLSRGAVHKYLVEMDERGLISYRGGMLSGIEKMEKTAVDFFSAPLVGSIACGDPESEEESVDLYISLPGCLFGKGEFYLLRCEGDSMEDAGICDGDIVLIRKQAECRVGDIVVALDDRNRNTLKRYAGTDQESGKAVLRYENEAVYPGKAILVDGLVVQGVARNVFHYL